MTHLPCSKATHAKVKIKPKSYSGCTRNFQRVPRLCWVLPGDVCLLPFLPHSLAGDKVNTQHFALVLHCSLFKQINPSLWHSDQMTEAFPNMKAACYTSSAARGCHRGGVPTSKARIHFSTDLRTIFGSLVSRITVVSGEVNAAQRPHPGTGHQWQHAFVSWHLHSIQKLENIWNLVITCFLWPFLVWRVTDLLFWMFLGSFKWQQMQKTFRQFKPK